MELIGRATARLAAEFRPKKMYLSEYVESEAWGYESANRFLNRGVLLITDMELSPEEVLDTVQAIEAATGGGHPHRNADGTYRDRPIDIDIIDIDGMEYRSPRLTLPHPRAGERAFVREPMRRLEEMAGK